MGSKYYKILPVKTLKKILINIFIEIYLFILLQITYFCMIYTYIFLNFYNKVANNSIILHQLYSDVRQSIYFLLLKYYLR